MLKLNEYHTDKKKVNEGVKVDIMGGTFYIRSLRHSEAQNALNRLRALHNRTLMKMSDSDVQSKITARVLAYHLVIKWENIHLDGKEFKYNDKEQALEFFQQPHYSELVEAIWSECNNIYNFKEEEVTKTEKK